MYGMVNKSIRSLVIDNHGEEAWAKVAKKAGLEEDLFLSNEAYPDSMTYAIVGAACEVLGTNAESLLEAFGEYWVLVTARESYPDLMASGGRTLEEFLLNLPNFHNRISLMFPHLQPPTFAARRASAGRIIVEYRSKRQGLSPFVSGLLKGLGKMYGSECAVTHRPKGSGGLACDEFEVTLPA